VYRHVPFRVALIVGVMLIFTAACARGSGESSAESATTDTAAVEEVDEQEDTATSGVDTEELETDTSASSSEQTDSDTSAKPTPTPIDEDTTIITSTGLQYTESEAGTGETPQEGDVVAVHYTGTLEDGTVFDDSRTRGEPIRFPLGVGAVIPGWDEGIALMSEGGKAILVIPPDLAYGAAGAGGVIPPNATLIFDVELVEVAEGAPASPSEVAEDDYEMTEEGLKYYDFVVGDGPSPEDGQTVVVHYTGWLQDGGKFDSSLDRGQPFSFELGAGQVIQGWDIGLSTMNVGGKRQLVIPADLGYGDVGAGGGIIPPDATLVFEVELLDVQ
jgi:peptidylprolyl isomerase